MKKQNPGFTLIEMLLAFLLFVIIYSAFAMTKGSSELNVRQNFKRDVAIRLLQSKMTEMVMKYQELVDKNGVESSFAEENGKFEAPYDEYTWKVALRKPKIEFGVNTVMKFLTDMGMDKDQAMAQIEQQKVLLTNLNKNISDNLAELMVEVDWEYFGGQSLFLITHLVPKVPKINLTTTAEDAG